MSSTLKLNIDSIKDGIVTQPTELLTNNGICFSFNAINNDQLFRDEYLNITEENKSENFNYLKKSNRKNGLFIRIGETDRYTNFYCNSFHQGYRIMVHNKDEMPYSEMDFNVIPVSSHSDVIVEALIETIDERAKGYPHEIRQCFVEGERELKYFKIYNKNNCEIECLLNTTLEVYNCTLVVLPIIRDYRMCDFTEFNIFDLNLESLEMNMSCNCLPRCDQITFDINVISTESDSTKYNKMWRRFNSDLNSRANKDFDPSKVTYSEILIFYRTSKFAPSRRVSKIWWSDFIADCGGLMGVFMGVSILSFVEIFYYCGVKLVQKIVKTKMRKRGKSVKKIRVLDVHDFCYQTKFKYLR